MAEFGKLDVYGDIDVKNNNIKQVNKINTKVVDDLETEAGAQSKVDSHANLTNNPHSVTKVQLGLGNVDNVQQAAKADFDTHIGASNPHGITKSTIGLGSVENKTSATIRGEITSLNVTTALGFTPEQAFTKNNAFNKSFGTTAGTVTQGDDSRLHTHSNKIILNNITASYTTEEQTKLAGVDTNANNYSHPTGPGNNHIPSGGAANNYLKYSSSGVAAWSAVSFTELVNVPSAFTPEVHDHDNDYVNITGDIMTGPLKLQSATAQTILNLEVNAEVPVDFRMGHTSYNYRFRFTGNEGGDANSLELWTANADADVAKVFRVSQDGILKIEQLGATIAGNTVYHTGNLPSYEPANSNIQSHISSTSNPHGVTKSQLGLGSVENKSSATIRGEINSSNVTTALGFTPENAAKKGANSGYAGLDANGKVPLTQLPDTARQQTYVVSDSTVRASLTGLIEGDKAFETSTGDSYIWNGSAWIMFADADWENISLDWSNISGKPTSSVTNIDSAVSLKHSHSNKTILDNTTASYTTAEETKLAGIATNANNYVHPTSHAASMITESTTRRFVSDTEKSTWNGKQNALGYTPLNPANNLSDVTTVSTARTNLGLTGDSNTTHYHDGRYYTKTNMQTSGQSSLHWNNVTNKPSTFTAGGGNADTVGGLSPSQFLRSDQSDTISGTLTVTGNINMNGTSFGMGNQTDVIVINDSNNEARSGYYSGADSITLQMDSTTANTVVKTGHVDATNLYTSEKVGINKFSMEYNATEESLDFMYTA